MIDYHDFCDINSDKEWRKKFDLGDIYSNGIICKKCGWYVRSKNRHNMAECKCGACAVDGGSWYAKITGDVKDIEMRTVWFNDVEGV